MEFTVFVLDVETRFGGLHTSRRPSNTVGKFNKLCSKRNRNITCCKKEQVLQWKHCKHPVCMLFVEVQDPSRYEGFVLLYQTCLRCVFWQFQIGSLHNFPFNNWDRWIFFRTDSIPIVWKNFENQNVKRILVTFTRGKSPNANTMKQILINSIRIERHESTILRQLNQSLLILTILTMSLVCGM